MKMKTVCISIISAIVSLLFLAASGWSTVYVDGSNTKGPWDGNSWATAYRSVQDGLADADKSKEDVWVGQGIYKPTDSGDSDIAFELRESVGLYGGFKGDEKVLDQRDWEKYETILSGDIGKPGDTSDNSTHVVIGADKAIIDGFTISDGNGERRPGGGAGGPVDAGPGNESPQQEAGSRALENGRTQTHISPEIVMAGGKSSPHGAGILNFQCAPTIRNCIFLNNTAGKGGAMYNMVRTSAGREPGMSPNAEPAPIIINCKFINNKSGGRGGAVSNDLGTHPTFIGCTFINNTCDGGKGGAIYNDFNCSPTIINSVFYGNSADKGGAIGNDGGSHPTITNCTFIGNKADDMGAALYQGTGSSNNPIVTNCIIWGNIAPVGPSEIVNFHFCNPVVTYSCVEGGYPGEGNFDANPLIMDAENFDFRLKPGSPCIDMGDGNSAPETDIAGNDRYDDKAMSNGNNAIKATRRGSGGPSGAGMNPSLPVDIGAYENLTDSTLPKQAVVYVDIDNKKGPWDGKHWKTAFTTIQKAIDYAYRIEGSEIWVAQGTYKPTSSENRTISINLRPGAAIYGGFKWKESLRSERNPKKNKTVLSGDIGILHNNRDNSYHVLRGADNTLLDGFTITGGNANGEVENSKGGGVLNLAERRGWNLPASEAGQTVSASFINCIFTENNAIEGGAVYSYAQSTPMFKDCEFIANTAEEAAGAILDRVGVNSAIENCTFEDNTAKWRGGAVYFDYGARPKITNCLFKNNTTDGHGGAVYTITRASQLEHTFVTIKDSEFMSNKAGWRGGAIANTDQSVLEVSNSKFIDNYAGKTGGVLTNENTVEAYFENCLLDDNSAGEGQGDFESDKGSILEVK